MINSQVVKKIEDAWSGGPLRIVGSSNGRSSKFVCRKCRTQTPGVYRVKWAYTQAGIDFVEAWLCGGCRSKVTPKQAQPEALQKYRATKLPPQ